MSSQMFEIIVECVVWIFAAGVLLRIGAKASKDKAFKVGGIVLVLPILFVILTFILLGRIDKVKDGPVSRMVRPGEIIVETKTLRAVDFPTPGASILRSALWRKGQGVARIINQERFLFRTKVAGELKLLALDVRTKAGGMNPLRTWDCSVKSPSSVDGETVTVAYWGPKVVKLVYPLPEGTSFAGLDQAKSYFSRHEGSLSELGLEVAQVSMVPNL